MFLPQPEKQIKFQNTHCTIELQRKRALNDPTNAGCINTRSACLPPKKMLMPFNSQSCRKRKKNNNKKKNWLLSLATRPSAELSPLPNLHPPTLPLSGVLYTLTGRRGDFMVFSRTQRLHYGSIRPNKLVLPSYPPVRRVLLLPPPRHTCFFYVLNLNPPTPIPPHPHLDIN